MNRADCARVRSALAFVAIPFRALWRWFGRVLAWLERVSGCAE